MGHSLNLSRFDLAITFNREGNDSRIIRIPHRWVVQALPK